jgi:hypothetical protein
MTIFDPTIEGYLALSPRQYSKVSEITCLTRYQTTLRREQRCASPCYLAIKPLTG